MKQQTFIIIGKCDIGMCGPAKKVKKVKKKKKKKKGQTRKANIKYNDTNKTSQSRTHRAEWLLFSGNCTYTRSKSIGL